MHQSTRLETIFSKKVLLIWHLVTLFLLVAAITVPIMYESPDADGLLSGPSNLLMLIATYGFYTLLMPPFDLLTLLLNVGSISLLGYTGLAINSWFKRWQWQFQLRFWLLGLACLWTGSFGWLSFGKSEQDDVFLLWGFGVLICAVVSAVLWESVNYALYRRRA